ncbi:MAG: hypothetical protein FJ042_04890 [Candidatus Cloacimonetes bacterium]|nr:hypothetical protein [Candidatus Cloacimonadota bacterium]
MENQVVNLHDKVQKLIEQYSQDKKKLEKLTEQYQELKNENTQLMQQIETITSQNISSVDTVKELEDKIIVLENKCQTLQATVKEFEELATVAITKIDDLIPTVLET